MMKTRSSGTGSKKELWLRLRNYHFEHLAAPQLLDSLRAAFSGSDPSTQAFADKLMRKLRWSRPFAMRAIGEYKKFLYLGSTADFPVTPPRVIDQVWHEHLLFSRGYREFCEEVLGREFDHHPELIPIDEQTARFQEQYDATLALYELEFGGEAPEAFWGTPKFAGRSDAARARRRPDRRDHGDATVVGSDAPLYMQFDDSTGSYPHNAMPEFPGGDSGGGGGGGEWGGQGSDGHAHADSTGGHGGDSGGSSDGGSGGGSDGGGSGCSSGCGGGD